MLKDFISTHTIICPYCNTKQTGILRRYDSATGDIIVGRPAIDSDGTYTAIKCCVSSCVITAETLKCVIEGPKIAQ